jgi:predicted dehydrogenase
MTKSLNVAVIGLGVGEQHARAYAALPSCRLRWLCDHQIDRAKNLAAELACDFTTDQFDQIVEDQDVNIVSIASFDDDHAAQVLACLKSGKHIFVEKPLCRSEEELRLITHAWEQHGGNLHLGCNLILRAAPMYRWLRDQIQGNDFGQIYAVDGDYLYGRLEKITQGWRKDVPDYSVMQGGGVHLVDLVLWLTGQCPVRVTAHGNRICTANTAFQHADYVTATIEFASGLLARVTANFGCVHRHQHVLRVFGTHGTFLYDDAGPRLHVSRDPSVTAQNLDLSPLPASKGKLIPSFVEAIRRGEDTRSATCQIFNVHRVCFACDTALKSATIVEITHL